MSKLREHGGMVLVMIIVFLVIASMGVTVALRNTVLLENQRRFTQTQQKMLAAQSMVGESLFQVSNEGGADMTYINVASTFPTNVTAFLNAGFFRYVGLTAAAYAPALDAYGNALVMATSGGNFRISSVSSGAPPTITIPQTRYQNILVRVEIKDKDGSENLGSPTYGPFWNDRYLWVTGNSDGSGIYQIGTNTPVFSWRDFDWDGSCFRATIPVGQYELRIIESDAVATDWMEGPLGTAEVRVPLWAYSGTGTSSITKRVRIAVDL